MRGALTKILCNGLFAGALGAALLALGWTKDLPCARSESGAEFFLGTFELVYYWDKLTGASYSPPTASGELHLGMDGDWNSRLEINGTVFDSASGSYVFQEGKKFFEHCDFAFSVNGEPYAVGYFYEPPYFEIKMIEKKRRWTILWRKREDFAASSFDLATDWVDTPQSDGVHEMF